jgi:hypothetical protein
VHECFSKPSSTSASPQYKFKVELRYSSFNPTATALLRIDTVDAVTLLPSSVGYCCFKLFATRDRVQATPTTESANVYISNGALQLPIFAGRVPSTLPAFDETMLSTLAKIPTSSLLVRILPAPKSADGISTLSKDEFPPSDWARLGLDVPAPAYASGEYYGAQCEPTQADMVCFRAKSTNVVESVESALLQAMSANRAAASELPPKPTASDPDTALAWLRAMLPPYDQMRRTIEYEFSVPHSIETGLIVSVEGLYNMPDAGMFTSHSTVFKVITSMSPPGLFYKDPPLYDSVYYTKTHSLEAHAKAPLFNDGFYELTPSSLGANLFLILDVRTVKVEAKTADVTAAKVTLEPPSAKKNYWTLLPLAAEKVPGQGYRYTMSGLFHLPLFEGSVPMDQVFRAASPYRELVTLLANKGRNSVKTSDGGVVIVKVLNPLLKSLVLPDLNAAKPNIQTNFMEGLLKAAISGSSGNNARIDKYEVEAGRFPTAPVGTTTGPGSKSFAAQLPKAAAADIPGLLRIVNKEFEIATGLVSR